MITNTDSTPARKIVIKSKTNRAYFHFSNLQTTILLASVSILCKVWSYETGDTEAHLLAK
jgi:hypothetical protein